MGSIMKNGIAYGGGGTDVVANPSGTATDTLEKLKVGSTVYDIAGGGSHIVQPPVVDQSVTYTYNRTEQTLQFTTLDTNNTVVTNNKKTDAGTYTCTVSLKGRDDVWADTLAPGDRTFSWTINPKTVTIPTVTDTSKTYNGQTQSPTISQFDSNEVVQTGTASSDEVGDYTIYFNLTSTNNYVWSDTTTTEKTAAWSIAKANGGFTLSSDSVTLEPGTLSATVTVSNVVGDGTLSVTSGDTNVATATLNNDTITITSVNSTSGTIDVTVSLSGTSHYNSYSDTISVHAAFISIYGVEWDGTSTTSWSRTDDSANFTDPSPAVNNGTGSSPFDNCMPWSGIRRVTDSDVGELVEIPKFWYKWTRDGSKMKLQIANAETEGFSVSPAHADRGDGTGERDVVYVGRYHCATSTYKSTTGVKPIASITRSTARTNIHNLGTKIWQFDYAMLWTIRMLYLVEFANWNSQATIGYGCGDGSATTNMGYTDNMQYHTGTSASSRTTYGGTQYRYIEGLWDNVCDWCDGIYFSSTTIYGINNPANFSDSAGGTSIGTRPTSNGVAKTWTTPSASGLTYALYPASVQSDSNYSTYSCDNCGYNSSGVVLLVGGYYYQSQSYGLFCMYGSDGSSSSNGSIGARLQKLP